MAVAGERPKHAHYLAVLWCLEEAGVRATRSRLASALAVSRPSVGAAVRALDSAGAIRLGADGVSGHEGHAIELTAQGVELARLSVARVRLVEVQLVERLGMSWRDASAEVGAWERAMSPTAAEALARRLDFPEVCPHGHPLPAVGPPLAAGVALSALAVGDRFTVLAVFEHLEPTGALLDFLESSGVRPGVEGRVSDLSVDGTRMVAMGGAPVGLAAGTADRIRVEAAPPTTTPG